MAPGIFSFNEGEFQPKSYLLQGELVATANGRSPRRTVSTPLWAGTAARQRGVAASSAGYREVVQRQVAAVAQPRFPLQKRALARLPHPRENDSRRCARDCGCRRARVAVAAFGPEAVGGWRRVRLARWPGEERMAAWVRELERAVLAVAVVGPWADEVPGVLVRG
jgi:hypothetical protein